MSTADRRKDLKLAAWMFGGVLLLIVAIALFTPHATENDTRPFTGNTGSAGARAALLTLQAMGRTAVPWDEGSAHIAQLDAPHTTLILAEPDVELFDRRELAARLKMFLERGGHVLLTGAAARAALLPGGVAEAAGELDPSLCESTPEGPGPLAAAGSVEMRYGGGWTAIGPQFRVEQRCGGKPSVVRFPVGAGEAVWWTSATPLTNAGLKRDSSLRLLLASIGEGRAVYFDEYYFGQHAREMKNPLHGLPLWALFWQGVLLCVLLVWSFSRRKGPLRMPVVLPRSSPLEFTHSMGGLYGKARATEPVVEASQRQMERLLTGEAGLSRETVCGTPEGVAEALAARFRGDWSGLRKHLEQARGARDAAMSPGDTLALVRALASDGERVRAMLTPAMVRPESVTHVPGA